MNDEKEAQAALWPASVAVFRPASINSSKRVMVAAWDARAASDTVAVRSGAAQCMQYTNAAVYPMHVGQCGMARTAMAG